MEENQKSSSDYYWTHFGFLADTGNMVRFGLLRTYRLALDS